MDVLFTAAAWTIICGSLLRVVAALSAAVRTISSRASFVRLQMGPVEALVAAEPLLLAAVTAYIAIWRLDTSDVSAIEAAALAVGLGLSAVAWDLTIWSFFSWRSIFFGHGVQEGQSLVTRGAYGFVRHPVYFGVILFWFSLAVGFLDLLAFAAAVAYVIPAYILYIRSEEKMMREEFGDEYRRYCQAVPMLVPRIGSPS